MGTKFGKRLARWAMSRSASREMPVGFVSRSVVGANRWIKRCGRDLPFRLYLERGVVDIFDGADDRWVELRRARRRRREALPTGLTVALWARTSVSMVAVEPDGVVAGHRASPPFIGSFGGSIARIEPWLARLLEHPLTRHFPPHSLAIALRSGVYRPYRQGSIVVAGEERLRSIFVVVSGGLRCGAEGFAVGDVFGDRQALVGARLEHDAVMAESGVLLEIDEAMLPSLVDTYAPGDASDSVSIINLDFEDLEDNLRRFGAGTSVRIRGGTAARRASCAALLLRRGVRVL